QTLQDGVTELVAPLQIVLPMLRDETPSFEGAHYTVRDAINHPAAIGRIPVMIGGSGEKKTPRMAAQYADEANLTSPPTELPHKLEVIAAHCERLGRDRSTLTVRQHINVVLAPAHEQASSELSDALALRDIDLRNADDDFRQIIETMVILGDPDEVGERLRGIVELGAEGITMSAPANGFVPDRVDALGEVAQKAFG